MEITPEILIEQFGEDLINDIRKSLKDKGVTFGGGQESKLAAQLRFDIRYTSKGISFQLFMPDYGKFVNDGRGPGGVSEEGRLNIAEWGRRKGYIEPFRQKDLIRREERQKQNSGETMLLR